MLDHFEELRENGYVILENILNDTDIRGYKNALNRVYAELSEQNLHTYPGGIGHQERLILNLHNKSKLFAGLLDHSKILPYLDFMLKTGSYQNSEPFICTQFSARDPHKGVAEQQLHIDSRFPAPTFPIQCIVLWMLDDFNEKTGATRLVPGSHKRISYPENGRLYPDEVRADAKAGSVIIYDGSLWHAGGKKTVECERWSIIASYSRWFVKPSFEMTKNTPKDIFDILTDRQKELFGYTSVPPVDENERTRTLLDVQDITFE